METNTQTIWTVTQCDNDMGYDVWPWPKAFRSAEAAKQAIKEEFNETWDEEAALEELPKGNRYETYASNAVEQIVLATDEIDEGEFMTTWVVTKVEIE